MDMLLESLLHDWDALNRLQDEILTRMPEYQSISRDYYRFNEQIRAALGPEYPTFDMAQGAYLALHGQASTLCGAHAAIRLLTSLL